MPKNGHVMANGHETAEPFVKRDVFFGTDRQKHAEAGPRGYFTEERGGVLTWGVCKTSVPTKHRPGQIERPASIFGVELPENPARHIILRDVIPLPEMEFYRRVKTVVSNPSSQDILIFVHGYNVSFEDAAYRTAQLSYDLGFPGAVCMYSWPSQGNTLKYSYDEASIQSTEKHFRQFLKGIMENCGARRIHLIAHSMGNRAVIGALKEMCLPLPADAQPFLGQLILAAPDVDVDPFIDDVPKITRSAVRVTMYASSQDTALKVSHDLHGAPRAGEGGADIIVLRGLDSVDASGIDTSLLGHSYYGDCEMVVKDLNALLLLGSAPPRQLFPRQKNNLGYWVMKRP